MKTVKHMILQLHITGKCNLRCKHCYIADHGGELSYKEIFTILHQFSLLLNSMRRKSGGPVCGHVHITGGEPFLHPQIHQILWLLMLYHRSFHYAIMSNGTVLKHLHLIKWLNLKALQVSIDGDHDIHDAIRGKGNLATVCQGLDALFHHGIRTRVSFTAHLGNYQLLPQVAEICLEHHVSSLWSDRYIPIPNGDLQPMDAVHMKEYVGILRSLAHNPKYQAGGLTVQNHRALQFLDGEEIPYSCLAGEGLIVVDENGDVYPCRRLPIACGNIRDASLTDIYYDSPIFQDLRRHEISEKCVTCVYKEQCQGGLRCMAYARCGKYSFPDPCCYIS